MGQIDWCSGAAALAYQASPGQYDWNVNFSSSACIFTEVKSFFFGPFLAEKLKNLISETNKQATTKKKHLTTI